MLDNDTILPSVDLPKMKMSNKEVGVTIPFVEFERAK
jgi:hypothetical protein